MRSSLCALALAAVAALSSSAVGVLDMPVPDVPPSPKLDTESSEFRVLTNGVVGQVEFGFDLSFDATASNNVEVALGTDSDMDGVLSFQETDAVVGWDCGRYFAEDVKEGRRYSSGWYGEPGERHMTYSCKIKSLLTGIKSLGIAVDGGFLCPTGVVTRAWDAEQLWGDTLVHTNSRHRIHWSVWRDGGYGGYYYAHVGVRDLLLLNSALVPVAPASVVPGGRVVSGMLGGHGPFVVCSSGSMEVESDSGGGITWRSTRGDGAGGLYLDVVGDGTMRFSVHRSYGGVGLRVYVDGVSRYVCPVGSEDVTLQVGGNKFSMGAWAWRPGWNMMRITRRGIGSAPLGKASVHQRGSILQLF